MGALQQLVRKLRREDDNPIHALDGWLLVAIERLPPLTIQELVLSCDMRLGPRRKGPELTQEQLGRWIPDALERRLISEPTAGPGGYSPWSVTDAGRQRLQKLRGGKPRIGGVLAIITGTSSVWAYAVARLREQETIVTGQPPPKRVGLPKITSSGDDTTPISDEEARDNLGRIEHIVVLMMENRSFDHMVGYLDLLDGQTEVRGLGHAMPVTYKGAPYRSEYLVSTAFPKSMDPPHGKEEIAKQIHDGAMDGFIESFAHHNDVPKPEQVMGYYTHRELPVYDYFAHNFALCDRWFSSVPSATWPNRVHALTGTCDPNRQGLFDGGQRFYSMESFVRLLEHNEQPDTWRWYSFDPGSLRLVDRQYRANAAEGFHHDHFRRVVQHSIEPGESRDQRGELELSLGTGLLEDAANRDLPRVAWVDPNFVDLSILEANSNDDHPPSDVRAGQELVMMVFRALAESPAWKDTMLVVTYDEHGGFYDHEAPDAPPEANPQFPTYGVRVPAFVVSPHVEPCTVSHCTFDHTSITRTILERFGVDGAIDEVAKKAPRVAKAKSLGRLLTRDPQGDVSAPSYSHVNARLESWRQQRAHRRSAASPELAERSREYETWKAPKLKSFAAEFIDGARILRTEEKLPPGHP